MSKIASYIFNAYSFITGQTTEELLNTGFQLRNSNPIPSFDEKSLLDLCSEAQRIFEKENNVLEINGDVIIVGDIHGSLHDLLRILKKIFEEKTKVLFLGDYIDRGQFSLECITLLLALKVMHPNSVFLIRGNHEFDSLCSKYGFKYEILNFNENQIHYQYQHHIYDQYSTKNKHYRYTENLYDAFIQVFSYLPIGAVINKTTFCIHGGLSPKYDLINVLNEKIKRPISSFEESELVSDLLWGDPTSDINLSFYDNPRGYGYLFNRKAVYEFININSIQRLVRAHQCINNGCRSCFNGKCITVFSASSYSQYLRNFSAVLHLFQNDDYIKATTFHPINRLNKSEAIYYKVQPFNQVYNLTNDHAFFSFLHPRLLPNMIFCNVSPNINNKLSKMKRNILSKGPNTATQPTVMKPKFTTNPRKSYIFMRYPASVLKSAFTCCNCNEKLENNENFNQEGNLQ